jgi:8-amino-7-oxononanoate synthase
MEGNTKIKSVANQLNQAGFGVKAILFPTVPKGQERIRISLHVFNEDAEIVRLTQLINRLI